MHVSETFSFLFFCFSRGPSNSSSVRRPRSGTPIGASINSQLIVMHWVLGKCYCYYMQSIWHMKNFTCTIFHFIKCNWRLFTLVNQSSTSHFCVSGWYELAGMVLTWSWPVAVWTCLLETEVRLHVSLHHWIIFIFLTTLVKLTHHSTLTWYWCHTVQHYVFYCWNMENGLVGQYWAVICWLLW